MNNNKHQKKITCNWFYVLLLIAILGIIINVLTFYPGFMSNDSLAYLYQAKGLSGFDNLHPIFTSLVWGVLIKLTGHVSAMLLFQIALIWVGSFLLASYLYKKTGLRILSLVSILLPMLPYIFNISGVLWSDVLYAGLMFVAVGMTLWLDEIASKKWRAALLITTLCVLMMAIAVRYNTIPATIPIIIIAIYKSGLFKKKAAVAVVSAGTLIFSLGSLIIVSSTLNVIDRGLINGPRLDDIVNLSSREEISKSSISAEQRDFILGVYDCSEARHIKLDVIHNCVAKGDTAFDITIEHTEGISSIWNKMIFNHLLSYGLFKVERFVEFIFPTGNSSYIWHEGIDSNAFGIKVSNSRLAEITDTIIHNLFYRYLPFLYEPWFWLAATVAIWWIALRRTSAGEQGIVLALSASAFLVIVSYFPTGATVDYRYIYWPAIACSIAILLIFSRFISYHKNDKPFLERIKNRSTT